MNQYKIRYSQPNAFEIYLEGGKVAGALQGKFTSRGEAQKAIDLWERTDWKRSRTVAKEARKEKYAATAAKRNANADKTDTTE